MQIRTWSGGTMAYPVCRGGDCQFSPPWVPGVSRQPAGDVTAAGTCGPSELVLDAPAASTQTSPPPPRLARIACSAGSPSPTLSSREARNRGRRCGGIRSRCHRRVRRVSATCTRVSRTTSACVAASSRITAGSGGGPSVGTI